MRRKTLFTVLALTILATIVVYFVTSKKEGGLVGPGFLQQITHSQSTPTPTPVAKPDAPKTFQFDSSTDLKQELESINPQVLDSDFDF